ncbi:putative transcriptional regulator, Crp/Fnr family [Spirochaeta thermophila DSM 6578]|uniref:Transcriptional regulator, Crp/Fnr family n=1 Tax=Winmispira thermophila (strain ATCC 700085 / DSM 6578 / Z-1203) TaxID=869211 RepID=G0GCP0_WINT7|nr:Crp/Fnr family transcriptional regulator [Spirochaeta thermophila]AEJ60459.1 putative transcriptional regulator, Crp/Fnr family [Spirochaeta thermophila DSM 6578]
MAANPLVEKYGQLFPAGRIIFKEGDPGDKMYIIQEGKVRISKQVGGKDHTLAILEKGDFFGEMALVMRSPRTATATAVTDVLALGFTREGFQSMVEKNARIALAIIDKLCRRLNQTNLQLQYLVRRNLKNLILLDLYFVFKGTQGLVRTVPYNQTVHEIALNKEVDAAEVERAIQDLIGRGILERSGNDLVLMDMDGLKAMVDGAER